MRLLHLVPLALVTALTAACGAKSINSVLTDPSRYRNQDVTISGTVTQSYSVMDRGVYLIEDRTGRLWVVSTRSTPRQGARVRATGTVREAFNVGSLGNIVRIPGVGAGAVLVESSRKATD